MPGLMAGLEIGKRALLTHQMSLQTIGHNIANVNTPGYTRQRVGITASNPEESSNGPVGSGVQVSNVRHIRDLFLGKQYREAQKSLGEWTYKQKTFSQIESIFNEPQDNALGDHLNAFWNSWSELSTNPDSASNRNAVLATARQLINGFNQLSTSLSELREATDRDLKNLVDEVNRLTSEIAQLNQQIKAQELGDNQAMDLRDARDLLTDELANIVDVNVIDKENGSSVVAMGAMVLVDDSASFDIGVNAVHEDGVTTNLLVWKNTSVQLQNVTGQLAGLLKSRDVVIPQYQAQLDELARSVVQQVNSQHTAGYGLDGTTGVAFFDPNYTKAGNMRLNRDIVTDINKIAATQSSEADVLDGNVALGIANLRSVTVMSKDTATMNDFYASLIGNLGVETRESTSFTGNYELLVQQIDNQRQAVQGVSLDEEMANLVKFQHAYDAAARVITVMDEALDTVISGMGMVGR
jgi:flagellar hook-associated protein 1 FlgK